MADAHAAQQQRTAALARANEVKAYRSALRRRLEDPDTGRLEAAATILNPPPKARAISMFGLLVQVHKIGSSRALSLLREAHVPPGRALGEAGTRERAAVVAALLESRR